MKKKLTFLTFHTLVADHLVTNNRLIKFTIQSLLIECKRRYEKYLFMSLAHVKP